jgi:hypothetical protein
VASATWSSTARQLVREYRLDYVYNNTLTHAFLNSIIMIGNCASHRVIPESAGNIPAGSANDCPTMPATTYSYSNASFGSTSTPSAGSTSSQPWLPFHVAARIADMNGDGVQDLLDVPPPFPAGAVGYQVPLFVDGKTRQTSNLGNIAGLAAGSSLGSWLSLMSTGPVFGDFTASTRLSFFAQFSANSGTQQSSQENLIGYLGDANSTPGAFALTTAAGVAVSDKISAVPFAVLSGSVDNDFDIDGDGLADHLGLAGNAAHPGEFRAYFSVRDRNGATQPFALASNGICPSLSVFTATSATQSNNGQRALTDFDGDGATDFIVFRKNSNNGIDLTITQGRGDGRFGGSTFDPPRLLSGPNCG